MALPGLGQQKAKEEVAPETEQGEATEENITPVATTTSPQSEVPQRKLPTPFDITADLFDSTHLLTLWQLYRQLLLERLLFQEAALPRPQFLSNVRLPLELID